MLIRSAKNKGMRLQKEICQKIIDKFKLRNSDIRSIPGSVPGNDIWLSNEAHNKFPFNVEAKNQEHLNIWKAIKQVEERTNLIADYPLVVFSRNRSDTYCCLKFNDFLNLIDKESLWNVQNAIPQN